MGRRPRPPGAWSSSTGGQLGAWTPQDWWLGLTVFRSGVVVGLQSLAARDLGITRQVRTSSWLGRRYQGQGIGTEMRRRDWEKSDCEVMIV